MPLDGAMLHFIKKELACAVGAKVDKVFQPSREELILAFRSRDCDRKLLLCSRANSPRLHFTEVSIENPAVPPMFCMLMRKRLCGSRLSAVRQNSLERVLFLDFDAHNELGDEITLTIAVEIMGRCSNIVLIDENNRVVDSIKRVDDEMSSQRMVLPGLFYQPVPPQDKLSPLEHSADQLLDAVLACSQLPLSKAVLNCIQGISPLVSRELALSVGDCDTIVADLTPLQKEHLKNAVIKYVDSLSDDGTPIMLVAQDGKPMDFSYMSILQYGASPAVRSFASFSLLLDAYYAERDLHERMKAKSSDLIKLVGSAFERASRKYAAQTKELSASVDREQLRRQADIITSNMYLLEKGMSSARLTDYYNEGCPEVTVRLDPLLTPAQNAQKYYHAYKRAQSAEQHLKLQLEKGLAEMDYLDSVLDALSRARTERELSEIRLELEEQGYIRAGSSGKKKNAQSLPPLEFVTDDGFTVFVGRNNRQNDMLTCRTAAKDDIWLHTLKIPGSHTVIRTEGRTVPDSTIEQAAIIAAYHSKAKQSGQVAVDFTKIRHVSKPNGSKPGFVIYTHQTTVYVRPDEALVKRLSK